MEKKKRFKTILIALVMAMAMLGAGYGVSTAIKNSDTPVSTGSAISETPMVPANFSDLAEKIRPGVVNIQVVKKVKNIGFRNFPGNPFGGQNPFGYFLSAPFSGQSALEGSNRRA